MSARSRPHGPPPLHAHAHAHAPPLALPPPGSQALPTQLRNVRIEHNKRVISNQALNRADFGAYERELDPTSTLSPSSSPREDERVPEVQVLGNGPGFVTDVWFHPRHPVVARPDGIAKVLQHFLNGGLPVRKINRSWPHARSKRTLVADVDAGAIYLLKPGQTIEQARLKPPESTKRIHAQDIAYVSIGSPGEFPNSLAYDNKKICEIMRSKELLTFSVVTHKDAHSFDLVCEDPSECVNFANVVAFYIAWWLGAAYDVAPHRRRESRTSASLATSRYEVERDSPLDSESDMFSARDVRCASEIEFNGAQEAGTNVHDLYTLQHTQHSSKTMNPKVPNSVDSHVCSRENEDGAKKKLPTVLKVRVTEDRGKDGKPMDSYNADRSLPNSDPNLELNWDCKSSTTSFYSVPSSLDLSAHAESSTQRKAISSTHVTQDNGNSQTAVRRFSIFTHEDLLQIEQDVQILQSRVDGDCNSSITTSPARVFTSNRSPAFQNGRHEPCVRNVPPYLPNIEDEDSALFNSPTWDGKSSDLIEVSSTEDVDETAVDPESLAALEQVEATPLVQNENHVQAARLDGIETQTSASAMVRIDGAAMLKGQHAQNSGVLITGSLHVSLPEALGATDIHIVSPSYNGVLRLQYIQHAEPNRSENRNAPLGKAPYLSSSNGVRTFTAHSTSELMDPTLNYSKSPGMANFLSNWILGRKNSNEVESASHTLAAELPSGEGTVGGVSRVTETDRATLNVLSARNKNFMVDKSTRETTDLRDEDSSEDLANPTAAQSGGKFEGRTYLQMSLSEQPLV